jgi:hypothetical protein
MDWHRRRTTPLVDKQTPEQAEAPALFLAFGSNALISKSLIVSHGWFME